MKNNLDFSQYVENYLLNLKTTSFEFVPKLILVIITLFVFYFLSKLFNKMIYPIYVNNVDKKNLITILSRISTVTIISLGFLFSASIIFPSITFGNIISILGAGGVAIGFAFKDIFQNFLAGILILSLQSFRIGDQIEVEGVEGTVEDIEIRATIIRTYDNRKIIIPNSMIFANKLIINTAYDKRRLSLNIGIGYGDDITKAKKVILKCLDDIKGVMIDPSPYVLVTGYGESAVNLEIRYWITPNRRIDVLEMQDAVLEELKPKLTQAGIDIPFPTHQILFHNQTEESDGKRDRQREGWPST